MPLIPVREAKQATRTKGVLFMERLEKELDNLSKSILAEAHKGNQRVYVEFPRWHKEMAFAVADAAHSAGYESSVEEHPDSGKDVWEVRVIWGEYLP